MSGKHMEVCSAVFHSAQSLGKIAIIILCHLLLLGGYSDTALPQGCPNIVAVFDRSSLNQQIENYNTHCTGGQLMHIDIADSIRITGPPTPIDNETGAILEISGVIGNHSIEGIVSQRAFVVERGIVTFDGLHFLNMAEGAILNKSGEVKVLGSLFETGHANYGGAIKNDSGALLIVSSSYFFGNTAYKGGAIYNTGRLAVESSTFEGNESTAEGGAIYHKGDLVSPPNLAVLNSTFSGNGAGNRSGHFSTLQGGGAISFENDQIQITHSTIVNNSGSGISAFGSFANTRTAVIKNTILAGNALRNCERGVAVLAWGLNFDTDGSCITAGGGSRFTRVSSEQLNLSPLGNHGGPTPTHTPQRPSVALDRLGTFDCSTINFALVEGDQRGYPRPGGIGCDVGAVELQSSSFGPASLFMLGDPNSDNQVNLFDGRTCLGFGGPGIGTPIRESRNASTPIEIAFPLPPLFPPCDINGDGIVDEGDLQALGNMILGNEPPIGPPVAVAGEAVEAPDTAHRSSGPSPGVLVLMCLGVVGSVVVFRRRGVHFALLIILASALSGCTLFQQGDTVLAAVAGGNFITIAVNNMPGGGLASFVATNGGFTYDSSSVRVANVRALGDFVLLTAQIFNDVGEVRWVAAHPTGSVVSGPVLQLTLDTSGEISAAAAGEYIYWRKSGLTLGDSTDMLIDPTEYKVYPEN